MDAALKWWGTSQSLILMSFKQETGITDNDRDPSALGINPAQELCLPGRRRVKIDLCGAVSFQACPIPAWEKAGANLIIVLTPSYCCGRGLPLRAWISLSRNVRCPAALKDKERKNYGDDREGEKKFLTQWRESFARCFAFYKWTQSRPTRNCFLALYFICLIIGFFGNFLK